MRVITYKTKLTEDKLCSLVKEKSCNYTAVNRLDSPEKIVDIMNAIYDLQNAAEEYMYLICTDTKCKLQGILEVSHGTVNTSLISPREVFIKALLCNAVKIILVHNHPSGESEPSREDDYVTRRIKEAGGLLNIELTDHIIIGRNCFYSYASEGRI